MLSWRAETTTGERGVLTVGMLPGGSRVARGESQSFPATKEAGVPIKLAVALPGTHLFAPVILWRYYPTSPGQAPGYPSQRCASSCVHTGVSRAFR